MASSMLKAKNLSNDFWAEIVACALYILNRSPMKSVKDKIPQEAWSGKKHFVSHLRIFGYVAYVLVPAEIRRKLADKSEKYIFIGYSEQSKAFRLYNPVSKKMITSRDVIFKEEEAWDGNIDRSVTIGAPIPNNEEEQEEHVDHPNQGGPSTPPRNFVQGQSSIHAEHPTPKEGNEKTPTFAKPKGKKMRRLKEIYEQGEECLDFSSNFALFSCDPMCFDEAVKEEHWIKSMDEEIDSIERNHTWELMDLPEGKDCIGVKWVYKTKFNAEGEIDKHKARLVAKGYAQQHGIDYTETFAPVARLDTVKLVLAIVAQNNWNVFQMDDKTTFLNGFLEEVYVKQPLGYEVHGHEDKVYRLKKALYGLKQAHRAWYRRIDLDMISNGFSKSSNEPTLYTKINKEGHILIVCLYVDDLIFTCL